MIDALSEKGLPVIEPSSERTITGAKLEVPFIHDQYFQLRTTGAQGRQVLVIGSGPKTDNWRALGCETLDINPRVRPDLVADANKLNAVVGLETRDTLVAECVSLDPNGKKGIDLTKFMPQAFAALKIGGQLFFVSATSHTPSGPTGTVLNPNVFKSLMKESGFKNIASWSGPILLMAQRTREIGDKVIVDNPIMQSAIIYYGQKI